MINKKWIITVSLIIPLAFGVAACSDRNALAPDSADNETDSSLPMVSNPHSSSATPGASVGLASVSMSAESIVYVSLPPRTLANAVYVRIRNRTTGSPRQLLVPIIDGGFDPIPIEASAGDVLALTISTADGGTIEMTMKVPVRRPPTIVRSDPPKGRTDVALNVTVTVVFSEPIDPKTVNATSVRLLHDGNPVIGAVRLSENSWMADFVPDKPLEPQSSYVLVVTRDIRDADGDSLTTPEIIPFTTGVVASEVLLTGFYVGTVTGAFDVPLPGIWLQMEHSGGRLSGIWNFDDSSQGIAFGGGVFSSTSSEGTFGTVRLILGSGDDFGTVPCSTIVAEVSKPDGSELSGRIYGCPADDIRAPGVGNVIVLKRF